MKMNGGDEIQGYNGRGRLGIKVNMDEIGGDTGINMEGVDTDVIKRYKNRGR